MKNLILSLTFLLIAPFAAADGVFELGKEANAALYHLSLCHKEIPHIIKDGAWVGKSQRWTHNKNYGYYFSVFKTKDSVAIPVGKIYLTAEYLEKPRAGGSAYRYICSVELELVQ